MTQYGFYCTYDSVDVFSKEEFGAESKRPKELEHEKQAAREEAWAKVFALELEINSAMRDLDFERRRLKGARERIIVDLVGGYYDAGDNVKFRLPMAFTITMISWSIIEYGTPMSSSGELGNVIDSFEIYRGCNMNSLILTPF